MTALENELIAYKNKLEAEKYENEAQKALVLQLEEQIHQNDQNNDDNGNNIDIQNEPLSFIEQVRFMYSIYFHSIHYLQHALSHAIYTHSFNSST